MLGINETNSVAQLVIYFTNNVTGSVFVTFLVIFIVLMAFLIAFRVPPFISVILILPLAIVFMAFEGMFLTIGGLLLIMLGIVFATHYIIGG
jgi:hypothetical protein